MGFKWVIWNLALPSALLSVGVHSDAEKLQSCVGRSGQRDDYELTFQAPSESDVISLMEIFSIRDRRDRLAHAKPVMIYVPPSTLQMGERSIQVRGFYIDQYEVSNAEYEKFLMATRRNPPSTWEGGRYKPEKAHDPVVGVTYEDAEAYAKWAGKRLPTEAEWEIAAILAAESEKLANFREDDEAVTNVAEWTSSCFDYQKKPEFMCIRRGTAFQTDVKVPLIDRAPMHKRDFNDFTGFRCVSDRPL